MQHDKGKEEGKDIRGGQKEKTIWQYRWHGLNKNQGKENELKKIIIYGMPNGF